MAARGAVFRDRGVDYPSTDVAARQQMLAAGVIDEADTARWQAVFQRLDRSEIRATSFAPMFSASGRKPT